MWIVHGYFESIFWRRKKWSARLAAHPKVTASHLVNTAIIIIINMTDERKNIISGRNRFPHFGQPNETLFNVDNKPPTL